MRVIFMGTPQLAVPVLKRIMESHHDVAAVVTQPDKPVGRRRQMTPSPVKQLAIEKNVIVLQPKSLKDKEFQAQIHMLNADVGVVFAYGKIIPQWLLDMPKHGLINIHASLLPRWRGAAPIQRAIMDGDRVTGVTIMQIEAELDAGDILMQQEISIEPDDTSGSIIGKVSSIGAELIMKVLNEMENGVLVPRKQDEALVTYAKKITNDDLEIDWRSSAAAIDNQVRGLNPKPGAITYFNGRTLKVWRVSRAYTEKESAVPGTIMAIDKRRGPFAATGDGLLLLEEVQPENKKKMGGAEFVRGYRLQPGDRLGKKYDSV